MSQREIKANEIFSKVGTIRMITKNQFSVDSQSDPSKSYLVKRLPKTDTWTCECRDFHYRLRTSDDKHCKHIQACILSQDALSIHNKIEKTSQPQICPKCYSTTIIKNGFRKVKGGIKRQIHRCKQCTYRFILGENGFSKVSSDPHIISEALNLVMSGMSYRNIARHIYSTRQVKISHVSIRNWIRKYTYMIKEYVESFYPDLGDVWSIDEMVLNVKNTQKTGKGFYDWLWCIIDPKTRFLIATEVSKRRTISDARKIIASGKELVKQYPNYVVSDSLNSYGGAIRQELQDIVAHVKTKSLKDGFVNRPVERLNNEIREKTKTRRGLGNDKSAKDFVELHKIHHNYVRPHEGLNGNTPAKEAGIDLNLGDDKYLDLIRQASIKSNFATSLGKRIEKVTIVNERDSIRVITKAWIDKRIWREINDILRLHGFSWLSNRRDSCWIKPAVVLQHSDNLGVQTGI